MNKRLLYIVSALAIAGVTSCGGNGANTDNSAATSSDSIATDTTEQVQASTEEVVVDQDVCDKFMAIKNPTPAQIDEMIAYVQKLNKQCENINSDNMTPQQEEEMSKILPLVEKIMSCDLSEEQLKKLEE
jgi:hypothetical protein